MKQLQVLQSELLSLDSLRANIGQIPGLPANPRKISQSQLDKLKKSLRDNPEMLALREILVFKYNGENVVIGGNQRIAALADLGIKEVPCKIIPEGTSADQLRAYLIKDNVEFGSWVDEILKMEWDALELEDFGMDDVSSIVLEHDIAHQKQTEQHTHPSVIVPTDIYKKQPSEDISRIDTVKQKKNDDNPFSIPEDAFDLSKNDPPKPKPTDYADPDFCQCPVCRYVARRAGFVYINNGNDE